MRIDLGELTAEGLSCVLPPAQAGSERHVRIDAAQGLRGVLATDEGGFRLSDLASERLALRSLCWTFGAKVELTSEQPAELTKLAGSIASEHGAVTLALRLAGLSATRVNLNVGALRLSAELEAREVSLEVSEHVGVLFFRAATLRAFELTTASLKLSIPELAVTELRVDWGGAEFLLEAGTAEADTLQVEQGGQTLALRGVELAALRSHGPELALGQTRVRELDVEAVFAARGAAPAQASADAAQVASPSAGTAPEPEPTRPPIVDRRLLDGLRGRFDVDVDVDLAVPILGRRRATHGLRLAIDDGALDYRELEHSLAPLEDSLLDFSVREGALVLERGLPLIKTRGRGKPILIWELAPADLALAEGQRVRLAVLPSFRVANKRDDDPPSDDDSPSAFRLQKLSLCGLDTMLTLMHSPHVDAGAVRELTFADLILQGELHHHPEGERHAGQLRGGLANLRTLLAALPLGPRALSCRLEIGALRDLELGFEGLQPRALKGRVAALAIADLTLT